MICAAAFARDRNDPESAQFLEDYADFLERHVEDWTVTTEGTLVPGIKRHYIRITPASIHDTCPNEDPNHGTLSIANQPPGQPSEFPVKEIVDGGFLQLVRFGIRKPDDPIILDSISVIDTVLKVNTLFGPCWHRYNQDGYGQRDDGGAFIGWGTGRAWPLLTGERGHYELAVGHDVDPYIQAMEQFASDTGLLPEQVWDEGDRPEIYMFLGRPTGSAMPLMWAHAEYINLLRSKQDGQVFDWIPAVANRHLGDRTACKPLDIWKFNRQVRKVKWGCILRIQAVSPFQLHWSADQWQTVHDITSTATSLGVHYVDIFTEKEIAKEQPALIQFTFLWLGIDRWENQNFQVAVE